MTIKEVKWRLSDHFMTHNDGIPTPKLDETVKIMFNILTQAESCSRISVCIGEVLDFDADELVPYDNRIYTDRVDFVECLADVLSYDFVGTDKEFEEYLEKEVEKYDPYWVKCIIIYVDN